MAMERISSPPFLDETAQNMLLALQGIRSAVQPANVYLDLDITLAVSGWSSAAPYTYNWTSDKINDSCSVKVSFLDGAEDTNPLYLEYEKTAGGIQFVAPVKPTAAIPVRVHIIYADANAITDVDDEMVSSSAISGAANVKEALQAVGNKIGATNQALTTLNSKISPCIRKFALGSVNSSTPITLSMSSGTIYGLLVGISGASARHILATITLRNNGAAFCTTISSDHVTVQQDGNNIVITSDNAYGAIMFLVPFNQNDVDNLVIT